MRELVRFAREEPFYAFLIVGAVCYAVVEVVAILHLGHTVAF